MGMSNSNTGNFLKSMMMGLALGFVVVAIEDFFRKARDAKDQSDPNPDPDIVDGANDEDADAKGKKLASDDGDEVSKDVASTSNSF